LTLVLQVGTLWKCGGDLFFEVPPMASNVLLMTLHPLYENVLQTIDHFSNHENGVTRQICKWSMVCSTFLRSGWSIVRSALLAKWDTLKKRPSLHLRKVLTQS